jgi:orotate phosphoribosyltransferase
MTEYEGEVAGLARPRHGHFDLGTGYHGDLWLDLDALFLRPALVRPHARWLAGRLGDHGVDAVCGPLAGGAFLAQTVADLMDAAFLPAYRSPGADPNGPAGYRLARTAQDLVAGWRVAIVDDAVNAGTAARSCFGHLRELGAVPVAVGALLALGRAEAMVQATMSVPFYKVATAASQVWPAGECELCADGAPLTDPSSDA